MKRVTKHPDKAAEDIGRHAGRIKKTRGEAPVSPLRGFGVFGVIGWSIAVPTVGGALLGHWLDRLIPQDFSWTIALILAGAFVGVVIAWRWVSRETRED